MAVQNSFNTAAQKIFSADEMKATEAKQRKEMPLSMKLFYYAVLVPEATVSVLTEAKSSQKLYLHEDTGKFYASAQYELEAIAELRKGFLGKKFRAQIADQWEQNLVNYKDYSDLVTQGKLKPVR